MPEEAQVPQMKVVSPFDLSGFNAPEQAQAENPNVVVAEQQVSVNDPAIPEVPQAPEVVDPLRQALEGMNNPTGPTPWDDNSKSLFKSTFGQEDPLAFHEQYQKERAEYEIYKKDAEEARALKAGLERISPAAQRMLQLEMEGKDAVGYVRSLPDTVIQNKPAADIQDKALIDTYKPGMITPEEWQAHQSGDYDEVGIDKPTLDYKIKTLRQMSEVEHEGKRAQLVSDVNKTEMDRQQFADSQTKAFAASIAQAQNDPFTRVFASDPQVLDQYRTGQLEKGLLTLEDGITPSPNKLTTILKAQRFEQAMKLQHQIGYEAGLQVGRQEGTSRMPSPTSGTRSNQQQPSTRSPDVDLLDSLQAKIANR